MHDKKEIYFLGTDENFTFVNFQDSYKTNLKCKLKKFFLKKQDDEYTKRESIFIYYTLKQKR